jgi:hypothetical protein
LKHQKTKTADRLHDDQPFLFFGVPKGINILRVYNLNTLFYWDKSITLPPKKSAMRE